MGHGEDYWHAWVPWFKALASEHRHAYKERWQEPEGWKGFYAFIETGERPAWIVEQQQKVAEAAIPPQHGETSISGYHRVLWLMRQHFKRVRADRATDDESIAEIYEAPDGRLWRLSSHATLGGMQFTLFAGDRD